MLFEGFARVWTPVLPSRRVKRSPVGIRVAGEKVVLFRGPGGAVGALVDRCPHRGVALSLGKVGDDGCIACPFHGWRFGPDGTARLIVASARDFATFPLLDPIFDRMNGFIAAQDQAVVESSDPVEVPAAGHEVSVATDRATLHFRKYYLDELRGSGRPAAPEAAPT